MSSSNVPERLTRMEDKLDFLINSRLEDRAEQKEICKTHMDWMGTIQKTMDAHEALKNRCIGAARVIAWVGGSTTIIGAIIAKILHHKGGIP